MNDLLLTALAEIGVREKIGKEDNPRIIEYFNLMKLDGRALKDETAWCSAFMNAVCIMANYERTRRLTARSWLEAGYAPTEGRQRIGDACILWRESPTSWKGHVGIYIREDEKYVWLLGGNQRNKVCIMKYRKSRVLGYRRLKRQYI